MIDKGIPERNFQNPRAGMRVFLRFSLFMCLQAAILLVPGSCEQSMGSKSALPGVPGAPQLIPGTTRLTASWAAASRAESYEVWVGQTDDRAAAALNQEVTGTFAVIPDLANDTPCWVWVRAKNSAGTGDFSPGAQGTPVQFGG
jgi:hypothetical protein